MKLININFSRELLNMYLCIREEAQEHVKYGIMTQVLIMGSNISHTVNTNKRRIKLS